MLLKAEFETEIETPFVTRYAKPWYAE